MEKIHIIGGSGFIGTRLCGRLLDEGVFVPIIVDKNQSDRYPEHAQIADVRDKKSLAEALQGSSTLINLAAEHRDDVTPASLYYDTNVVGAENVCRVAEKNGIQKIVFTSTVAIYGFAPLGTDESGAHAPFNDYGKSKLEAEGVYIAWQKKDPLNRSLVIVRPTVVFGEGNRGNVYNLIRQIASGRFAMIGSGTNKKSMAYVENIAGFLQHSLGIQAGIHIYNYVDKPDFDMNQLVGLARNALGLKGSYLRMPYIVGMAVGKVFDLLSLLSGKKFPISSIRVKKFCSDSLFESSAFETGFSPPVSLNEALEKTITHDFSD